MGAIIVYDLESSESDVYSISIWIASVPVSRMDASEVENPTCLGRPSWERTPVSGTDPPPRRATRQICGVRMRPTARLIART